MGTYDARTGIAKVFVNGRLKAEAAGKGLLSQDWDAHAGIGKHKGSRFLQGELDEFRIYNKSLSQREIQNLMRICSFERGKQRKKLRSISTVVYFSHAYGRNASWVYLCI